MARGDVGLKPSGFYHRLRFEVEEIILQMRKAVLSMSNFEVGCLKRPISKNAKIGKKISDSGNAIRRRALRCPI